MDNLKKEPYIQFLNFLKSKELLAGLDYYLFNWLVETGSLQKKPCFFISLALLFMAKKEGSLCLDLSPENAGLQEKLKLLEDLFLLDLKEEFKEFKNSNENFLNNLKEFSKVLNSNFIQNPEDFKPLILENNKLYFQKYFAQEKLLKAALDKLTSQTLSPLNFYQEKLNPSLNDLQKQAVSHALKNRVSVISGGPGTGKTFTLQEVLKQLFLNGISPQKVALAAPTGKAASRMQEVFTPLKSQYPQLNEAQTLHRLLSFKPFKQAFTYHQDNPLPYDVIILDEVSMIGVELMNQFLLALKPSTRLILTGDQHQLPSVDAGHVLSWLVIDYLKDNTTFLTQSYRSKGLAHSLANKINQVGLNQNKEEDEKNTSNIKSIVEQFPFGSSLFSAKEKNTLKEEENCRFISLAQVPFLTLLEQWVKDYLKPALEKPTPQEQLEVLEKVQILCYQKKGLKGTTGINQAIFNILGGSFKGHFPLLITHNDYDLQLFNGDIGILHQNSVYFSKKNTQQEAKVFSFALINNFEPSFALTVHKSQGSEYDHVLIILPDDKDNPLLTRELLYTALTRSKKSVVIYGTKEVLEKNIQKKIIRQWGG